MNWIFQGNPDTFDVDGYLRDLRKVTWTIRQKHYAPDIQVGDRVFFWRSQGSNKYQPGIIAIGKILSRPVMMPDNPESMPYWRQIEKSSEDLRVWIEVTHCKLSEGYIVSKDVIAADPVLKNLTILRQPRTTNYKIGNDEGERLFSLFTLKDNSQLSAIHSYSWTIVNDDHAYKVLDKSAFLHWGTGIPIAIRPYFINQQMDPGERRDITLVHDLKEYPAHVALEANHTARTRLFWNSDFSTLLKTSFPHHHKQYNLDANPSSKIILQFNRLSGYDRYQVSFAGEVPADTALNDIEADVLEDKGPQKEGGVKEYYGKRYERSPINRKMAIQVHGLTCNACGFNFEAVYGARGSDYIEVHHVKPIATFTEEQPVDPKLDLVTLCSNCHRMIHRQPNNILTVDQLKNILEEMRQDV